MLKTYDSTLQAYTEHPPKNYDTSLSAWVDSPSAKTFDKDLVAWVERLKISIKNLSSTGLTIPGSDILELLETSMSVTMQSLAVYIDQYVSFEVDAKSGVLTIDYDVGQGGILACYAIATNETLFTKSELSPGNPDAGVYSFSLSESGADLSKGIKFMLQRVNTSQYGSLPFFTIKINSLKLNNVPIHFN